jgi:transcriptional regulator with XRE-family HTH domain
MKLKDWRNQKNLTLREAAVIFGVGEGKNPSRRMQRIESGESPVDPFLSDTIIKETAGDVSLKDLTDTRRDYLSARQMEALN